MTTVQTFYYEKTTGIFNVFLDYFNFFRFIYFFPLLILFLNFFLDSVFLNFNFLARARAARASTSLFFLLVVVWQFDNFSGFLDFQNC